MSDVAAAAFALRLGADPRPLALALAAALVLAAVLEARTEGTRRRRLARFALRALVIALVACALARPALRDAVETPRRLVVALDRGSLASAPGRAMAARILSDAQAAAGREGALGVRLLFGESASRDALRDPLPEEPPSPAGPSRLAPALAAARLAASDDAAAVLLLSDGRADGQGARAAAGDLASAGIPLRVVCVPPPPPPRGPGPAFEALDVPDEVRGPFAVRAAVRGMGRGTARLLVDGEERVKKPSTPAADGAEVEFDGLVLAPGLHEVAVAFDAEGGGPPLLRRSLLQVRAPPRALYVSDAEEGAFARRALAAQGFDVAVVSAAGAFSALADARLDLVALDADAPIPPETAAALVQRVREGLGLVVLAGRDAQAWGRLSSGPLASALPLLPEKPLPPAPPPPVPVPPSAPPPPRPDPEPPPPEPGPGLSAEKRPEEALPISLLLVIDRSGSMAFEQKLPMAILAAEEAASTLAPTDRVGVISFADESTLDTPLRPASTVAALGLVGGLRADGNTDIYGALARADKTMREERSPIRHVILLTDGMQTGTAYFTDLVTGMAEAGITLTTVGLGDHIDELRLKSLARLGRGRFFFAPGPRDLPRILTRDTKTVLDVRGEQAERARLDDPSHRKPPAPPTPQTPPAPPAPAPSPPLPTPPTPPPAPPAAPSDAALRAVRRHEAVLGFDERAWPRVGAPFLARTAPGTVLLLEREDAAPVLAAGRTGLGRVLAFALPSDDARFTGWVEAPRLLAQAARSVVAPVEPGPVAVARVTPSAEGDLLRVSLPDDLPPGAAASMLAVAVLGPDGERPATPLGVEDGEAVFALPPSPPGSRVAAARLTVTRPDGSREALPPLTYVPRSGQPAGPVSDPEALQRDVGVALSTPDAAGLFDVPRRSRDEDRPLAPFFLAAAVLLLPLDVLAHRRGAVPRPS